MPSVKNVFPYVLKVKKNEVANVVKTLQEQSQNITDIYNGKAVAGELKILSCVGRARSVVLEIKGGVELNTLSSIIIEKIFPGSTAVSVPFWN